MFVLRRIQNANDSISVNTYGNRTTYFKHKMTQTKVLQYGGTKMTSHGILRIQKSHFGHYFLHDLFHLRDRSLHYAPK